MKKLTLLPRIIIAILLGVLLGQWMPEAGVRVFVTYNYLFSQFLRPTLRNDTSVRFDDEDYMLRHDRMPD